MLTKTIKEYFDDDSHTSFRDITTKRFAEFKQDAINLGYEVPNSLTKGQFEQKWSNIYDISYPEICESFLMGQQDYGVVVMSNVTLSRQKIINSSFLIQ